MKFEQILTKKIENEDVSKLNIISFKLSPLEKSSKRITYLKRLAPSPFYGSGDIRTGNFFKNTSLLIDKKSYESFKAR